MNDEIKEIKLDHFKDLEELKQNVENWIKIDEEYWERWFGLSDLSNLLDYITNLQKENDILNDITESYEETSKEQHEEIERLNNNLKSLYKSLEIIDSIRDENVVKMQIRNLLYNYKELKGSDKDEN